ncbi:MAG: hypothetical protein AABW80_04915 [Nanoarchaeota archaeon]
MKIPHREVSGGQEVRELIGNVDVGVMNILGYHITHVRQHQNAFGVRIENVREGEPDKQGKIAPKFAVYRLEVYREPHAGDRGRRDNDGIVYLTSSGEFVQGSSPAQSS